jgi:signal transduction histidine kinase
MSAMSLRQRILLAFTGCASLVALLFGISSIIFAYHTEDQLFAALLHAEGRYIQQQLDAGVRVTPRLAFVAYHKDTTNLPDGLAELLTTAPTRTEFAAANGRHYHLLRLATGYLVADVTEQLVVRNVRPQLVMFLLGLLLLVVLLSAGLAYLLASRLLKPLHKLTQIVDSASQQSLDAGLSSLLSVNLKQDEIGRLASTLQQAWCRLAQFVQREKQFTQDISHELRTPVTVSQGALTLLSCTPLTSGQAQLVERLNTAQQQISQSIETLMLLAREQLPPAQSVKLLPVVEQSILQQAYKINGKPVELQVNIGATATVVINETVLLILLNNLLGNAFEYTAAGVISIQFQHQLLTVQDSGSGIAADIREQVFTAGVKGKNSQGMGVGLCLVKRLCEQWQIGCSIDSDNLGTCVSLQFPE